MRPVTQFLPKVDLLCDVIYAVDMFKQNEILLCICYSTKKSDIGIVLGFGDIF